MNRWILALILPLCIAIPARAQTTDELWRSLMDGNRAYVAGKVTFDHLAEHRHESAAHQHPPVTILSCSDSRVPPELIFNRAIDALFVIRVAGNVAGPFDMASIEYAIANGYTKMIVVMGHAECGAVNAALSPTDPATPSLVALVQRIRESFGTIETWSKDATVVRRAVEANARGSAAYLIGHSQVIRDAVQSGKVAMVVAYYDLESGEVQRLTR